MEITLPEIVIKRNGTKVGFDENKIVAAISKANASLPKDKQMWFQDIIRVTGYAIQRLGEVREAKVENIQDIVEDVLIKERPDVAKAYIRYRETQKNKRDARISLMDTYEQIFFGDAKDSDLRRDNANVNTDAPMGKMLKLGAEGAKYFADHYVISEKYVEADKQNYMHIHDKDFSLICINCLQQDLAMTLKNGFNTGHGFLREPNSIRSAAALSCIAIQSVQNDMLGGQSISCWDGALAPYVNKSFKKALVKHIIAYRKMACIIQGKPILDDEFDEAALKKAIEDEPTIRYGLQDQEWHADTIGKICTKFIYDQACQDVEEETKQAMEAAIHNFNTLHSRAGCQVPFSSINFGLDTTPEGRLVTRMTLEAIWNGLGNGETPIFPISIFLLKAGVNYNPEDPNYDLFKLACKVSAKRLFPNFLSNDSSFNIKYYKPGDYRKCITAMGCRTRVVSNVNGPEETSRRGNFSFVTINLPMLALEADHNLDKFFKLYDKYILLARGYLKERYEIIAKMHVYNYPFLMGQGLWMGSENLKPMDEIREVLKHASLSIGFCGLAECLVALIGKHHGESAEAQELGLRIVRHLRKMTDKFTEEEHMNWTCFATPAESTAGQFLRATRKRFGVVPGVTEHGYFTNSFHVPVYYPIKAIDKIRIEAPYHSETNAGHISYIEMDGDPLKNLDAFESLVRAMHDNDMGYFSINHPVDRDPVCGYTGIIDNECPHCHRREDGIYEFKMRL